VVGCPSPGAFVYQFLQLVSRRHTPIAAPVGGCGIVGAFQLGLIVGEAVVAVFGNVAVFGKFAIRSIGVFVG